MKKLGFIAAVLTLFLAIGGVDTFAQTKKEARFEKINDNQNNCNCSGETCYQTLYS